MTLDQRQLIQLIAHLRKNATLESGHVEEQVRVVLRVHADKRVLPVDGRHGARKPILDVPKHSTSTETHTKQNSVFDLHIPRKIS